MAINKQPIARKCRSFDISPAVMGYSNKKSTRNPGGNRRKKVSEYGAQLKEKQKQQYSSLQDFINSVVLPEMQIKLRQGFGRAIRTETDTCVIAMLDDRAATGQRYHAAILQALPKMAVTDDLEDVERFIWKHKPDRYFKEGRGYLSYGTSREDAAGDTEPNS